VLFDGNDDAALAAAHAQWSSLKESGHDLTYWQQTDEGRWEKRD
jgi:DNA polymerase-3 subunit chi